MGQEDNWINDWFCDCLQLNHRHAARNGSSSVSIQKTDLHMKYLGLSIFLDFFCYLVL